MPPREVLRLIFVIMIDKIINLSESSIKEMIAYIKDYKIKAVPGENGEKVCK